ncbi:MAG: metallophosphoesterase [Bacillota bacterium]|nr:metallophosphoesterase [Bacillota bacterium]
MRVLKKCFIFLILFLLLGGGSLFYYCRCIAPFHFQVEELTLTSPYVSPEAQGKKLLVLADVHLGTHYSHEDLEKVVEAVNEEGADFVLFLGDLFDDLNASAEAMELDEEALQAYLDRTSALLARIEAAEGKYAVFGNHDYGGGAETVYPQVLEAGGFTLLINQQAVLSELGLSITGIDDVLIGYGDPAAAAGLDPALFNIVLVHEPDVADQLLEYDADLILAGHTHGGQVRLAFLGDSFLPPYGKKYVRGLYEFENARQTRLYVNPGVGVTILPLRFLSPPEITVVCLESE